MITEPDGIEVVATHQDAAGCAMPALLVIDAVRDYFDAHDLGSGDLAWARIGDGQANITYAIQRGSDVFVLRRGPRPPYPKSAHNMIREAKIQKLVGAAGVAVPEIVAVCEDQSVIGAAFYVMNYLDGVVITDTIPAALQAPEQRRATAFAAVDTLARLHQVDVKRGKLSQLGKPEGYLERQVELFSAQWEQTTHRSVPEVRRVGSWLAANVPKSQMASVVHGDYRLGNLMYRATSPASVYAILDWEMATIGDPLADLGYLTATYVTADTVPSPMDLTPVTREPGYPTREELVARYQEHLSLSVDELHWYQSLALWKAAVFCEAMYARWLNGERRGDTFAPTLENGVPTLARAAARFAGIELPEGADTPPASGADLIGLAPIASRS